MNEKTLNELKAKKAAKLEALAGIATRMAAAENISTEDAATYPALKQEIKQLESMIADTQAYLEKQDSEETVKTNTAKTGSDKLENFFKRGETVGLKALDSKEIKAFDRSKATVLVPADVETEIRMKQRETSVLRRIARVRSINGREHLIPVEGNDVQGYWVDEGADFTAGDTTVASKKLVPYKNGALIKVTTELLEDSITPIESYIRSKIVIGLNKNFETAALLNTDADAKKPLGLVAQASVGVETNGGAGVITTADLETLYFSVKQAHRKKGTFLVASAALPLLIGLTDENGNRIYYPSFVPNVPDTLFGKPIEEVEELGNLAVGTFPIIFGDFSQLEIGERKGIAIARLEELFRTEGKIGFIAEERIDSVLVFDEAIKTLKIGEAEETEPEI